MIRLLARIFIPNRNQYSDPTVRQRYGVLCGAMGIVLNALLFFAKLLAGILSGSIAITADAFNNLSDAGSSLITLVGFRLAGQKPDPQHPFGHGRFEYISGLFVSMAILLMGFELAKSSVEKILHPEQTEFNIVSVAILAAAILVKLYMAFYNRSVGKKIDSAAMLATMTDSFSDAISSTVVLAALLLSKVVSWNIDGYCGAAVAIMILIAGIRAARDTISPLLGQAPDGEFVKKIEETVLSHEEIAGIHDLIVNDYGPGRKIVSLHAEVPVNADLLAIHDLIDNIEGDLERELGCLAVIHMDPIATDDEITNRLRRDISEELKEIDPKITIHDLRTVAGPTHTNVIFDAVLPYECNLTETEARKQIVELVAKHHENTNAVVCIDRSYT